LRDSFVSKCKPVLDNRAERLRSRAMDETTVAPVILFLALTAASLGALFAHSRFPAHVRDADTLSTVRTCAALFALMTSLVLGLMISSARETFESVDHGAHEFATSLILLDRTLEHYGPDADNARSALYRYVQRDLKYVAPDAPYGAADRKAEQLLDAVGDDVSALSPADARHIALWNNSEQEYQQLVGLRWTLVEQAGGTIPDSLLILLSVWLVAIFANFGFCAPRNGVVIATLVLSAFLVSSAVYLILDMDVPYSGPIKVSVVPLERALAEMQPH
jgi:hypothetical protein